MANEIPAPTWAVELASKHAAGISHVFLLHGNIRDYVGTNYSMQTFLTRLLMGRGKEVIAFYNRSEGITFPMPEMKDRFVAALGLDRQAQDPVLQALGNLPGGGGDTPLPRAPLEALSLLERFLRLRVPINEDQGGPDNSKTVPFPGAVVVEYLETLAPNGSFGNMSPEDRGVVVALQRWAQDPAMINAGNPVVLLTQVISDAHASLRTAGSRIEAINIPLPDSPDRLAYIDYLLNSSESPIDINGFTRETLTAATAGMTKVAIEDVELRASQLRGPITRALVQERKQEITHTEYGDVLEFLEPEHGFESVGGLEHVKTHLQEMVKAIQTGDFEDVPMGVALFGPPGTGKTFFMKAAAKEAGFNAVALNFSKILGSFVGQSERQLEMALTAINALAPVMVLVDEIDQSGIGRGSGGDSGVGNRLFKRLLEYISDQSHRGRVVFFFASNRPDLIDAALKRPGRMDVKIPFTVPDKDERESIFLSLADRHGITLDPDTDLATCAKKTEKWTGAEIEIAILKARRVAKRQNRTIITQADLEKALWAISPSTSEIDFQTLLAIQECNDRDLLPAQYREKLDNRQELANQIQNLAPEGRRKIR